MHYRARGSIGFLKIQKVVISKHLFHIKEKPPNKKFCTYWDGYDPNFAPNIFRNFLESKSKHLKGRSGPRVSHVFDSHIAGWLYGRSGPQVRHVFDSHIAGWL